MAEPLRSVKDREVLFVVLLEQSTIEHHEFFQIAKIRSNRCSYSEEQGGFHMSGKLIHLNREQRRPFVNFGSNVTPYMKISVRLARIAVSLYLATRGLFRSRRQRMRLSLPAQPTYHDDGSMKTSFPLDLPRLRILFRELRARRAQEQVFTARHLRSVLRVGDPGECLVVGVGRPVSTSRPIFRTDGTSLAGVAIFVSVTGRVQTVGPPFGIVPG